MSAPAKRELPPAAFWTVKETAAYLRLDPTTVYALLDRDELQGRYQGRRRYVVAASVPTYIASLSSTPSAP